MNNSSNIQLCSLTISNCKPVRLQSESSCVMFKNEFLNIFMLCGILRFCIYRYFLKIFLDVEFNILILSRKSIFKKRKQKNP